MIKTIIKRDGTKEAFSAEKLNGWSEWASMKLGRAVNWSEVVLHAVSTLPETCTSQELQECLIQYCLGKNTWEYNLMAGRLYAALLIRIIHKSDTYPTVKEVQTRLIKAGLMRKLDYSDEEYEKIEKIINHDLNMKYPHYALHQNRKKYSLQDKVSNKEFETSQFIYMRMAMAVAEHEPSDIRLKEVKEFYEYFAKHKINVPTPYYVNLGTKLSGFASCCVYTTKDTAKSLAAADHIAYMMTVMSAGIGYHLKSRSIGDPVRGGAIEHQGKVPYARSYVGALGANLQNGRGGAGTMYYNAYDPEVETIAKLKNPITPLTRQVRGSDYSFGSNRLVVRKAAKNEDIALFSYYHAPDLYEAMYSGDQDYFEELYEKFLASKKPRTMVSARKIVLNALTEAYETGRHYEHFTDLLNIHTPFLDPIYSGNLCVEIALPTSGFNSVEELYQDYNEDLNFIEFIVNGKDKHRMMNFEKVETQRGNIIAKKIRVDDVIAGDLRVTKIIERSQSPEIALCNIGGIIVSNIENDEDYERATYRVLKLIRYGINNSEYVFKQLGQSAKSRMNAGVGIVGLAHLMAKKGHKYTTQEGKNFIHEVGETHYWHLANAALRIGKEYGNAAWMHKTKWPDGWLPIDTYNKNVDELVTVGLKRDWEKLRSEIKENGGIGFSVLACIPPSESSSVSGATTNSVYPTRELYLNKTNETLSINFVVPESTKLKDKYEIAWDIPMNDLIDCYAILQKWTDQAISADLYEVIKGEDKVSTTNMLQGFFRRYKYGLKQRYYMNTKTTKGINLNSSEVQAAPEDYPEENNDAGCGSGGCTL